MKKCQYYCCRGELCNYRTYPFSSPNSPSKRLTCYKYQGKKAEWNKYRHEVTCWSDKNTCMEAFVKFENGHENYVTGCASEEHCQQMKHNCGNGKYKECEIHCCSEKQYSGGSSAASAGFIAGMCTVAIVCCGGLGCICFYCYKKYKPYSNRVMEININIQSIPEPKPFRIPDSSPWRIPDSNSKNFQDFRFSYMGRIQPRGY